jgi:hypothetical protein
MNMAICVITLLQMGTQASKVFLVNSENKSQLWKT